MTLPIRRMAAVGLASLVFGSTAASAEERSVKVEKFDRIEASGGLEVDLAPGDTSVTLQGDAKDLDEIRARVSGGSLKVDRRQGAGSWFGRHHKVTVVVRTPSLKEAEFSGGIEAHGTVPRGEELSLSSSGGVSCELSGIDARSLKVEGSGGASYVLKGKADLLKLDASGGVKLRLGDLTVREARVSASGGVNGKLYATEVVRGDASGGVNLEVRGPAKDQLQTSGGTDVTFPDQPKSKRAHHDDQDDDD